MGELTVRDRFSSTHLVVLALPNVRLKGKISVCFSATVDLLSDYNTTSNVFWWFGSLIAFSASRERRWLKFSIII